MMTILGGAILVLGFVGLMGLLDLVGKSIKVFHVTQQAMVTLGDPGLDDNQKEKKFRSLAGDMLKLFIVLVVVLGLALGLPLGVVFLMDMAGWLDLEQVIALTLSWQFIVIGSVIMIVAAWLFGRGNKQDTKSSESYSGLEKNLHYLAFSTLPAQISMSSLMSRLNAKKLAQFNVEQPVFITAIPRAGTTLLLELCVKTGEFVSHTYRDMPFVITPLLWNKFSKLFKQSDEMRERAHGDGMMVNADSPEAFEEILWHSWWPSRYRGDRIVPWTETHYPEFEKFLKEHFLKLVALGHDKTGQQLRYISKNNLNISRIPYLRQVFPDAIILLPFRSPMQHALSLLRQHKHFSSIHKTDEFASYYMRAIGHYDFGANLRPVDFNKWLKNGHGDPMSINFWLNYWIHAYQYLQTTVDERTRLISFEAMCGNPQHNLQLMAEYLHIAKPNTLTDQAERISLPRVHEIDPDQVDADLMARAKALHLELMGKSLAV